MIKHLSLLAFLAPTLLFAQKSSSDSNFIFWNKNRRLQESDFQIKVANVSSTYGFAQFASDYNLNGAFSFGLGNYKKRIRNYFIKSASWLDTTYNVAVSIRRQQTLFDLAEVYIRQFRKSLYENRKKIIWGTFKVDELNAQMLTNFSKRRVEYNLETDFGTIVDKQQEWEHLIEKELDDLKRFSAD